ncbi:MAG: hypothetical protein WCJ26_04230 [bacterium]
MKTHPFPGIFSLLFLLVAAAPCSGQSLPVENTQTSDSGVFFFYVDYCGSRYNKVISGQELVIDVVILPAHILDRMPHLKNNGLYSSKNMQIREKQQKLVREYGRDKMIVRVNRKKFNAFYPDGLKKGFIIKTDEFNRWDFIEKPAQIMPPIEKKEEYHYFHWYWYLTDPVNIKYGMTITA